jgi:hypothetical protein
VVRIPAHSLQRARKLALQSWVKSKQFPKAYYMDLVESFREKLKERIPNGESDDSDSNPAAAMMLGGALDSEGALLTHTLEKGTIDISDDGEWLQICIAGGWCVLQLYERDKQDG